MNPPNPTGVQTLGVVFLYRAGHVNSGSKIMRCDQLVDLARARLGARYDFSARALPRSGHIGKQRKLVDELRGKIVVFLKRADRALEPEILAELRGAVRGMCIDYVDAKMLPFPTVPMDVHIAASRAGLHALRKELAREGHIPQNVATTARLLMHHADPRLTWIDRLQDREARIGYFGLRDNAFLPDEILDDVRLAGYAGTHVDQAASAELQEFNVHYAVREIGAKNRSLAFKPFTKGCNAAASGAAILVNRQVDDAAVLLGDDYPFMIDDVSLPAIRAGLAHVKEAVGTSEWKPALEAMAGLRDECSPEKIADQLAEILEVACSTPSNGTEVAPLNGDSLMPTRSYRRWGEKKPSLLIATCMKDEGPFILEWIAWHKALGVTDFVVFSNDCTDGTDAILECLELLGEITHLENPAVAEGSTYFQPVALKHLHAMPPFNSADFVISMDVDEFINIHVGEGRFSDLLESTGPFDALSMSELNHGSNDHVQFEPGWVTELFPAHQTERPGRWKAARGVKTITRLSPKIVQIRNHRPDFSDTETPIVWVDGSGRTTQALGEDPKANGIDCRGAYDLVTLEHYPLRSMQSYLVKKHRGDVVVDGRSVDRRYWRLRNQNQFLPEKPYLIAQAARDAYAELLKDPDLAALHQICCSLHAKKIKDLSSDEEYLELQAWIQEQPSPALVKPDP